MKSFSKISFSVIFAVTCGKAFAAENYSGKAIFDAAGCRACHRVGPTGGNSGPDLTLVGFRHSREWLDRWLLNPQAWKADTLMPNFRLTTETREALVDYLVSLNGNGVQKSAAPWNNLRNPSDTVSRGHALYVRAGCVACHGVRGSGGHPNNNVPGNMIPALDHVSQAYTKDELVSKITDGSKPAKADPSGPEPLVSMPAWGQVLGSAEITAVADYLLALGSTSKQDSW